MEAVNTFKLIETKLQWMEGLQTSVPEQQRAWEEEEHGQIIFRGVSLPPPRLNLAVAQHLKSSVNVETSLRVCVVTLMSSNIVHPLFLNLNLKRLVTKNTRRELVLGTCFFPVMSLHVLTFFYIYIWTFICPYIFICIYIYGPSCVHIFFFFS
jgi:hypothetical protein